MLFVLVVPAVYHDFRGNMHVEWKNIAHKTQTDIAQNFLCRYSDYASRSSKLNGWQYSEIPETGVY